MILLVGLTKELDLQVAVVHSAAKAVMAEQKVKLNYMVGTTIEVPRGALTADEIAPDRRVLQLRPQRPHPDVPGREPRRLRQLPAPFGVESAGDGALLCRHEEIP